MNDDIHTRLEQVNARMAVEADERRLRAALTAINERAAHNPGNDPTLYAIHLIADHALNPPATGRVPMADIPVNQRPCESDDCPGHPHYHGHSGNRALCNPTTSEDGDAR